MERETVDNLLLDPENPRLTEELFGAPQSRLFEFLYENGVLDELVDSMLDNGFFEHEPLIVLPKDRGGKRVVVEGNRRLAALMLIHEHPAAAERQAFSEASPEMKAALKDVPIFEVQSREDVSRFLGFRHISGLKPWKSEAKARYIAREVERAASGGEENPFVFVGRRVGSNAQGVRNSYMALAILRHARDECGGGSEVSYVMSQRFGVWLRCMNSLEVRSYIGFGGPKTYEEVRGALRSLVCEKLLEVIQDLAPRRGRKKAVLADSRDVTRYGEIISNDRAREVLRKFDDLNIAHQVVEDSSLPDQVLSLAKRIDALTEEIQSSLESASRELHVAADTLARSARFLNAAVGALVEQ